MGLKPEFVDMNSNMQRMEMGVDRRRATGFSEGNVRKAGEAEMGRPWAWWSGAW